MSTAITWLKSRLRHTFTLHRWALNPFQMYDLTFLFAVAIVQVVIGATPASVQSDLDHSTLLALATANIFGCIIALTGLHLRELESALWVEFCGYLALIFVLGTFVFLVATNLANPNASVGFALAEAFVAASIHRSTQILFYKRARHKHIALGREATALRDVLNRITPDEPIQGKR